MTSLSTRLLAMPPWALQAVSFALALLLSLAIAALYTRLHKDKPYQPSLPLTIAVSGVIAAIVVLAIGDSIARGLGLVGAVALVRFRSNLKDPLDLVFTFASLATGVAVGAHAFFVAVLGTAVFCLACVLAARFWLVRGSDSFDAILSFRTNGTPLAVDALNAALEMHTDGHSFVRIRQILNGQEHAYQVKLRQPAARTNLFTALGQIGGIGDTELVAYEQPEEF
jgi:uncharacterized membrane protein YhiD involved in acid resistance